AIIMAWYPGMEGGNALADIIFGKVNPCAKLPCVFPKSESQLPFFDKRAKCIEYDLFHGYRLMDREDHEPAFPFGFGLSYTTYKYGNLQLDRDEMDADGTLHANVEITNTGDVPGEEIAQLYTGYIESKVERPLKELKSFSKLHLKPGETKRIEFVIKVEDLAYYDEQLSKWIVEPITYIIYIGPSSRREDLLSAQFRVRR
ncbi:MAG: fibronectin type III-like domain-contianing protein, partial [Dehalococcoidia bacterium]